MSYPYQYNDPYSTPTTPSPYPWDVQISSVEQQDQLEAELQQQVLVESASTPASTSAAAEIALPPPERIVPSQQPREGHSNEPVRLHPLESSGDRPHIHIDTTRRPSTSSSTSSAVGPIRVSPTRGYPIASHPYRRPSSATGVLPMSLSRRRPGEHEQQQQQHVRFIGPASIPQYNAPSPVQPRVPSLASSIGASASPITRLGQTTTLPVPNTDAGRRFIIRTDVHYNAETHVLTAMLELPGVKKSELGISLSTCLYNRVKSLTISGKSEPVFPERGYTIKERKFGQFVRTLAVPPETRAEDVSAELEDGILTLKISCGPPAESEDRQEITIR